VQASFNDGQPGAAGKREADQRSTPSMYNKVIPLARARRTSGSARPTGYRLKRSTKEGDVARIPALLAEYHQGAEVPAAAS